MTREPIQPELQHPPARLRSIDFLRGFDMFWITGGAALLAVIGEYSSSSLVTRAVAQTHHAEWHGFTLWDLVFPLFLFLAGTSLPLSMAKRSSAGASRRGLHIHVVRRGLTLVFLGMVYNGLFTDEPDHMRYASVLGRIGLAWLLAAVVFLNTRVRGQVLCIAGLLLSYWAALHWVPVPGFGAGNLAPGATLTDYLDRQWLPGRLHRGVRDPEGLLATLPAVATALSGALAGHWLMTSASGSRKSLGLLVAGAVCLGLGVLWHPGFPVNKNLWTSSFVLVTSGSSLILLALSHQAVDVWRLRGGVQFFIVFGSNAVTIYMLERFVDWHQLADRLIGWTGLHAIGISIVSIALRWLLLYAMYRRRWFVRV